MRLGSEIEMCLKPVAQRRLEHRDFALAYTLMRDEEAKAARPAAADAKAARNKDALSGLAARVARLEARAWRGKQAE